MDLGASVTIIGGIIATLSGLLGIGEKVHGYCVAIKKKSKTQDFVVTCSL